MTFEKDLNDLACIAAQVTDREVIARFYAWLISDPEYGVAQLIEDEAAKLAVITAGEFMLLSPSKAEVAELTQKLLRFVGTNDDAATDWALQVAYRALTENGFKYVVIAACNATGDALGPRNSGRILVTEELGRRAGTEIKKLMAAAAKKLPNLSNAT